MWRAHSCPPHPGPRLLRLPSTGKLATAIGGVQLLFNGTPAPPRVPAQRSRIRLKLLGLIWEFCPTYAEIILPDGRDLNRESSAPGSPELNPNRAMLSTICATATGAVVDYTSGARRRRDPAFRPSHEFRKGD